MKNWNHPVETKKSHIDISDSRLESRIASNFHSHLDGKTPGFEASACYLAKKTNIGARFCGAVHEKTPNQKKHGNAWSCLEQMEMKL